ncbi:MAG: HAMP domain-containing histidine kinase, partial [Pirellulales bacterium]|nr:HAMP domain-containing histidine kinase [Pirellulales bacterium]
MLHLQLPADAAAPGGPALVPLATSSAHALERSLLAADSATRYRELLLTLAADPLVLQWALRAAEHGSNQTMNRSVDAADWLCTRLEAELARYLVCESSPEATWKTHTPHPDPNSTQLPTPSTKLTEYPIELRLPRLVEKLAEANRHAAEFERRLQHEKLESLKELAYGASHEINNPLANIAARAQTLLADEPQPERRRKLIAIHRQALRAHEMISDLMLFAR